MLEKSFIKGCRSLVKWLRIVFTKKEVKVSVAVCGYKLKTCDSSNISGSYMFGNFGHNFTGLERA